MTRSKLSTWFFGLSLVVFSTTQVRADSQENIGIMDDAGVDITQVFLGTGNCVFPDNTRRVVTLRIVKDRTNCTHQFSVADSNMVQDSIDIYTESCYRFDMGNQMHNPAGLYVRYRFVGTYDGSHLTYNVPFIGYFAMATCTGTIVATEQ